MAKTYFNNKVDEIEINDYIKSLIDFKHSIEKPATAQGKLWVHYLDAFAGEDVDTHLINLNNNEIEISCYKKGMEHMNCGKIGLVVTGECSAMFKTDCGSFVVNGERLSRSKNVANSYNDFPVNGEAFIKNTHIEYVFIKSRFYNKFKSCKEKKYADMDEKEQIFFDEWEYLFEKIERVIEYCKDNGIKIRFIDKEKLFISDLTKEELEDIN